MENKNLSLRSRTLTPSFYSENKRICFVSIDVERDRDKKNFFGVENLEKILAIFQKHKIPLTLFVTGRVLEKYATDFKEWAKFYEIACHGFSHLFWDELDFEQRKKELEQFINLYQGIFNRFPRGFRAPSHLIDEGALKLLENKGFSYDSSVVPHYPSFKRRYRGYKGKAPLFPYRPSSENCRKIGEMKILEIPVTGQLYGTPLAGSWINKLPILAYELLFGARIPCFLCLSLHSFDVLNPRFLNKLEKILALLEKKNYQFLKGEDIFNKYESLFKNRK